MLNSFPRSGFSIQTGPCVAFFPRIENEFHQLITEAFRGCFSVKKNSPKPSTLMLTHTYLHIIQISFTIGRKKGLRYWVIEEELMIGVIYFLELWVSLPIGNYTH